MHLIIPSSYFFPNRCGGVLLTITSQNPQHIIPYILIRSIDGPSMRTWIKSVDKGLGFLYSLYTIKSAIFIFLLPATSYTIREPNSFNKGQASCQLSFQNQMSLPFPILYLTNSQAISRDFINLFHVHDCYEVHLPPQRFLFLSLYWWHHLTQKESFFLAMSYKCRTMLALFQTTIFFIPRPPS